MDSRGISRLSSFNLNIPDEVLINYLRRMTMKVGCKIPPMLKKIA